MIDLDNWLSERYQVSTPVDVDSLDEARVNDRAGDETEGDRD